MPNVIGFLVPPGTIQLLRVKGFLFQLDVKSVAIADTYNANGIFQAVSKLLKCHKVQPNSINRPKLPVSPHNQRKLLQEKTQKPFVAELAPYSVVPSPSKPPTVSQPN